MCTSIQVQIGSRPISRYNYEGIISMKLLKNNEERLRMVAAGVNEGEDLNALFLFMRSVMKDETPQSVGLAAPQVGVDARAIVIKHSGIDSNIINPYIDKHCAKKMTSVEGCLSCPGVKLSVGRWKWIVLKGFNDQWEPIKFKFHGFLSIVAQHELDHLDGITLQTRINALNQEVGDGTDQDRVRDRADR